MNSESGSDVDVDMEGRFSFTSFGDLLIQPDLLADVTITRPPAPKADENAMEEDTPMELSVLAASTRMTELSYTISDIQTQLFEIQELRHAEESNNSGENHLAIERAMSDLKEAVALVDVEFGEINANLAPVLQHAADPTAAQINEHEPVLRKHAALSADWQAVHQEVSRLHNELQEDQLLVRFRTAVEQAAGMMDSLDKAVEACQEFIWRRSEALRAQHNETADKPGELWSHFAETVEHYERVKKYYYQSSTQAMASIDKTMGSRDFKNGEVFRRHTELSARWKSIRERIARTDREIELLKKPPEPEPSESGSVRSRTTTSSRPESQSTSMSTSESLSVSTLSQSISPLRKLAARVTSGFKTPSRKKEKEKSKTGPRPSSLMPPPRVMSPTNPKIFSPPANRPSAQSIFSTPNHLSSSASLALRGANSAPAKPRWNSSTKVQDDTYAIAKPSSPRTAGHMRHASASASGRQSAMSGRQTPSRYADYGVFSTPRGPNLPSGSRPQTPGSGPRKRPMSPSNIPAPIDVDIGPPSIHKTFATPIHPSTQNKLSPPKNIDNPEQMSFLTPPKARRASHSRIPAPVFHNSRPTSPSASSTSYFPDGSTSPMSTQFASAVGSPIDSKDHSPFQTTGQSAARPSTRVLRAPPSSYRGSTPMPTSARPSSRGSITGESAGRRTSLDRIAAATAQSGDLTYVPNPKDALDVEVARVANSLVHPYFIERVSDFVKGAQGPDASAQYSFTLPTSRKVMVCKLVIVEKSAGRSSLDGTGVAGQQRRVICRVGGGWESLSAFLARSHYLPFIEATVFGLPPTMSRTSVDSSISPSSPKSPGFLKSTSGAGDTGSPINIQLPYGSPSAGSETFTRVSNCTGKKKAVCVSGQERSTFMTHYEVGHPGSRSELIIKVNVMNFGVVYTTQAILPNSLFVRKPIFIALSVLPINLNRDAEQFGFRKENIVKLTDDTTETHSFPTKENIISAMLWLVEDAKPGDSLFFHFSGHGGQTEDLSGEEIDSYDEVIYPVDFEQNGYIVDDVIHDLIVRPLPAGCRLTALFDCSHSGTSLDLPYVYTSRGKVKEPSRWVDIGQGLRNAGRSTIRGDMKGMIKGFGNMFNSETSFQKRAVRYAKKTRASPADVVAWAACKDFEKSDDVVEHAEVVGAMCYAFIEALRKQPKQSYQELLNNIRDLLYEKHDQKPQLTSSHPITPTPADTWNSAMSGNNASQTHPNTDEHTDQWIKDPDTPPTTPPLVPGNTYSPPLSPRYPGQPHGRRAEYVTEPEDYRLGGGHITLDVSSRSSCEQHGLAQDGATFIHEKPATNSTYASDRQACGDQGQHTFSCDQPIHTYRPGKKKVLCVSKAFYTVGSDQQLIVIQVGINYVGQSVELQGCVNDAYNVSEFLTQFGYKEENIRQLTDSATDPRFLPTRENIISGMHWLVKDAQPTDALFFHFSGHGGQTKDLDGDEADGFDEGMPINTQATAHALSYL
ncbi:Peptidase C14, partial [Rhizoctonia solani]